MRQHSKSPQPEKPVQNSKRNFKMAPSIGLPSCYPASPMVIALNEYTIEEQKAFESLSRLNSLMADEDSIMMSICSTIEHQDSMSTLDTTGVLLQASTVEQTTIHPLQQQPSRHHRNHSMQGKPSHCRRQRNRAFSDDDFAAIMSDYSTSMV